MEHLTHYTLIFAPLLVLVLASFLKKKRLSALQIFTFSVIVFFALFHLAPTHALSSHNMGHGSHSVANHPCCMPQTPSIAPLADLKEALKPVASILPRSDELAGFLAPHRFTTRSPPTTS